MKTQKKIHLFSKKYVTELYSITNDKVLYDDMELKQLIESGVKIAHSLSHEDILKALVSSLGVKSESQLDATVEISCDKKYSIRSPICIPYHNLKSRNSFDRCELSFSLPAIMSKTSIGILVDGPSKGKPSIVVKIKYTDLMGIRWVKMAFINTSSSHDSCQPDAEASAVFHRMLNENNCAVPW